MADSLDLKTALEDLNTNLDILWADRFEQAQAIGDYQMYTEVMRSSDLSTKIHTYGPGPVIEEWFGAKELKQFREYDFRVNMKHYQKSVPMDIDLIKYDSAQIGQKLRAWFSTQNADLDKITFDARVSNSGDGPVGFDGENLFSTAHPHGPSGGTQSNKTTDALSFASYDAAYQAVQSFRNEVGESFMSQPMVLEVGPKNRKVGKEIVSAERRPLVFDNTGSEATSSVVAGITPSNVFEGDVILFVNPRLTGTYDDYWYLYDTSVKPMLFLLNQDSELVAKDDPKDDNVFWDRQAVYSIHLEGTPAAGFWPAIYGGIL